MKSVKDKLIITAAVGFTAASTMVNPHFTNVLAEEIKDPAFVKEDASKTKTEKEKLEDSVKDAKSNLDEKKAEVEAKKEAVDASKEIVDDLTEQKANQQAALDSKLNYEEELYNNLAQKINDLNKEIANKQAELKKQEAKHEAAKKTLDNAKHDLEDKEQTRDELKAELDKYDEKTLKDNLDKASQAVDQANKDYEATEQLKNDTLSKLEAVNKNVEAKKTELENSKVAHQNAINDVAAKQAAVDKAQADVDSFNQSDALDTAKSDLAKAQTNLETAKANAKTASDALTNAESDYNNALKEQTSKQEAYDASVTELDNAKIALENANETKASAQQAYDNAKNLVDEKANLIKDYENAYTIAQQQVASAEKRVEQAQKDYDSGKTEKEIAQEKLDEFEKTNKELIDLFRNREGTKTFFQYLKADSAVELLSNPGSVLKDYTTLGGNDDATNTNYLNYVFDYIDECNKIRKDLGLNELKVSAYLMADAELNANYAAVKRGHSGANVSGGENHAFGYGAANGNDSPFRGWYDKEKKIYDGLDEKYKKLTAFQLYKTYPDVYMTVGHYLNIVDPSSTVTGFAFRGDYIASSSGIQFTGPSTFTQEFDYSYYHRPTKDVILTTTEFKDQYRLYWGLMNRIPTEHYILQQNVLNASDTKSDEELVQAKQDLVNVQHLLEQQKKTLDDAKAEKANLDAQLTAANTQITSATSAVQNAQNAVDDAQAKADASNVALNIAKEVVEANLQAKLVEQTNKNNKDAAVKEASDRVNALSTKISDWDSEKAKAEEALNNAKKDLEVSKQAEKDAQTLVNQKQNAYEMVLKDKGTVEDNLNSVNNSLAAAQKALDDANTNYQVASQKVAEFNTKQDELNNLKDEIEAQNSLVERYVQDEKDAQAVVKETKEKIVALTKDKDNTENQKEGQGKVLAFMRRVREQGSNADLSDVDDSELVLYLSQYAREVDELNRIEQDLATANARYFRILEEYENAKQAQDEAQAEYESAMKKLDTYIKASAKHAKKDEEKKNEATTTNKTNTGKVNTGVETQFVTNAALMGFAALCIVEAKKRSKK